MNYILAILAAIADYVRYKLRKKQITKKTNLEVLKDAKDKISNNKSGADLHTDIERIRLQK